MQDFLNNSSDFNRCLTNVKLFYFLYILSPLSERWKMWDEIANINLRDCWYIANYIPSHMCANEIPFSSQNLILDNKKIITLLYFELKKCLSSLNLIQFFFWHNKFRLERFYYNFELYNPLFVPFWRKGQWNLKNESNCIFIHKKKFHSFRNYLPMQSSTFQYD